MKGSPGVVAWDRARCAVGAGYRPRLPARPAGLLGGQFRLARAETLTERLPSLPARNRWCPSELCVRAGARRPRNLENWLAELLRRVPVARALADGPGCARHWGAQFRRGDSLASWPRILRKASPDGSDMLLYVGVVAPPDARHGISAVLCARRRLRGRLHHVLALDDPGLCSEFTCPTQI